MYVTSLRKILSVLLVSAGFVTFAACPQALAGEKVISITGDHEQALAQGNIVSQSDREDARDDVLKMRTDRPAIVKLETPIANVLIGNDQYINVIPDSRRSLIIMPLRPGTTFFRAIDGSGNTVLEKRVIVAAPKPEYVRVRHRCDQDDKLCKVQAVYYCPDMCHNVYAQEIRNLDGAAVEAGSGEASGGDNPEELSSASESEAQ